MSSHETYDVLVIGARVAGAATAMLMAERGLEVLLVDRGCRGSDTLSTHALMRGGILQLRRWGLLARLEASGTPPVRRTVFHYGDETVDIAIKPSHGVDALYAPRRTVLDPILVEAAAEAGAVVRFGTGLVELLKDEDGRVTGAVLQGPAGDRYTVTADLVVGADGAGSTVARLAGAAFEHRADHATAVIYGYWAGLPDDGYHWHYRPGVSAGVIPTTAGPTGGLRHCVFASMPPARLKGAGSSGLTARYREVLAENAPALAGMLETCRLDGRLTAFAGRPGFLRQAAGPGWALVGDAGYFKDPITAHGMTDALRDAEFLADAAAAGTATAFAGYGRLRVALSLPLLRVTDRIAAFAWDLDEVAGLHRELNRVMQAEVEHLASLPANAAAGLRGRPATALWHEAARFIQEPHHRHEPEAHLETSA
jgi:2-polyprenyl-6-methoxyphenol hydroxylase-like FAD-dependent oxidoreductase